MAVAPSPDPDLRIVLLGKVGCGKSASGNTILGREAFRTSCRFTAVTKTCERVEDHVYGRQIAVIDTPGLDHVSPVELCASLREITDNTVNVFLLVIQLSRFTEEQRAAVQKMEDILGERARENTMILFTHGDSLKSNTIENFIRAAGTLVQVVQRYGSRYHVFNNESGDHSQVEELLEKIGRMKTVRQDRRYIFPSDRPQELRIILLGKTGVGKSATANTILGREAFITEFSPSSVTSLCEKVKGGVDGQIVSVVDTPGIFDTKNQEDAMTETKKCVSVSAPGPHVFLVVLQLGRFTPEEQETVKIIQRTFGEEAEKYTMALFTHGDDLEGISIEEYVGKSQKLQNFVQKCKGGYNVFNNKEKADRSQVTQLLEKINTMVKKNGGSYYTNERFQEAERAIEEGKQRILREKAAQIQKEKEDLERKQREELKKLEGKMKEMDEKKQKELEKQKEELKKEHQKDQENLVREHEQRARDRAERTNTFIKVGVIVALFIAAGAALVVAPGVAGPAGQLATAIATQLAKARLGLL